MRRFWMDTDLGVGSAACSTAARPGLSGRQALHNCRPESGPANQEYFWVESPNANVFPFFTFSIVDACF